jgi:predicted nucleic acid-binding Zn ribbon protein
MADSTATTTGATTGSAIKIASAYSGSGDHKHCEICGKSIALDGRVCSDECVKGWQVAQRMKKRSVMIVIGMVFLMVIFTLAGPKIFGLGGP